MQLNTKKCRKEAEWVKELELDGRDCETKP